MINVTGDSESDQHHNNQRVFTIFVMVVTVLVGVPGNLMVIWITSLRMKWTVNTIWYWNLALADIMCCLFIPLSIAQFFHDEWLYGPTLCKVIPVIVHLTMFASVFTLVAISVDRCLQVVQPVWAQNKRNLRMAWFFCVVIWMFSFLMCLPAALHRKTFSFHNMTFCNYDYNEHMFVEHVANNTQKEYETIDYSVLHNSTEEDLLMEPVNHAHPMYLTITYTRMIFGFLVPLLVVSTSYILLALKVHNSRLSKFSRKTTKVALSIVVAFFVTWAPYHIIGVILLYFQDSLWMIMNGLSVALAYFNSCINPILYVFMGKNMKSRVQQSIRRLIQNALSEEVSRSTERTRSKLTTEDSFALSTAF